MEDVEDPVIDIDRSDLKDPLAVVEYIDDIMAYYKGTEVSCISYWNTYWYTIGGAGGDHSQFLLYQCKFKFKLFDYITNLCSIFLANCSSYLIQLVLLLLHNWSSELIILHWSLHSSWGIEIEDIVWCTKWYDWGVWGCKHVSTNIRWTAFCASSS